MIVIQLGSEPDVLKENATKWGEEFEAALKNGQAAPHRYRNDEVKEAIRNETHGKCAYCESYIEHVAFAHIEHIIPKSIMPLLVCSWQNLTLACPKCNTYKGDYYSVDAPLLNPYVDAVDVELAFHGPMAIDRSDKARLTISKLRLNRPELLFRREGALRGVLQFFDLLARAKGNHALTEALLVELQDKLTTEAEYSSCSHYFASVEGPKREDVPQVECSGA